MAELKDAEILECTAQIVSSKASTSEVPGQAVTSTWQVTLQASNCAHLAGRTYSSNAWNIEGYTEVPPPIPTPREPESLISPMAPLTNLDSVSFWDEWAARSPTSVVVILGGASPVVPHSDGRFPHAVGSAYGAIPARVFALAGFDYGLRYAIPISLAGPADFDRARAVRVIDAGHPFVALDQLRLIIYTRSDGPTPAKSLTSGEADFIGGLLQWLLLPSQAPGIRAAALVAIDGTAARIALGGQYWEIVLSSIKRSGMPPPEDPLVRWLRTLKARGDVPNPIKGRIAREIP
jgi:hypothetical protein